MIMANTIKYLAIEKKRIFSYNSRALGNGKFQKVAMRPDHIKAPILNGMFLTAYWFGIRTRAPNRTYVK